MWQGRTLLARLCSSTQASGKRVTLVADGPADEGDHSTKAATRSPSPIPSATTPVLPVSPAAAYRISASDFGQPATFILDTGAAVTLLHKKTWDRMKPPLATLSPWTGRKLVSVEGTSLTVLGSTKLPLQIASTVFSTEVVIADGLATEGILGLDFLESHGCMIDMSRRVLQCGDADLTVPLCSPTTPTVAQCAVILSESVRVPPSCELEVMAQSVVLSYGQSYLLEPLSTARLPIRAARALVSPSVAGVPV